MPETFEIVVPLRWSDQDLNGHINHARIVTLLEESRILWRRSADELDTFAGFGRGQVVASITLDYRRPVEYGSDFTVSISVGRIGTKSYQVRLIGRQGGEVAVDAHTTMVMVDDAGSSRALTEVERQDLARWSTEAV